MKSSASVRGSKKGTYHRIKVRGGEGRGAPTGVKSVGQVQICAKIKEDKRMHCLACFPRILCRHLFPRIGTNLDLAIYRVAHMVAEKVLLTSNWDIQLRGSRAATMVPRMAKYNQEGLISANTFNTQIGATYVLNKILCGGIPWVVVKSEVK